MYLSELVKYTIDYKFPVEVLITEEEFELYRLWKLSNIGSIFIKDINSKPIVFDVGEYKEFDPKNLPSPYATTTKHQENISEI